MAEFKLSHPRRGTVTVQSAARRDALLGRGYSAVEEPKPAPAKKAPAPKATDQK